MYPGQLNWLVILLWSFITWAVNWCTPLKSLVSSACETWSTLITLCLTLRAGANAADIVWILQGNVHPQSVRHLAYRNMYIARIFYIFYLCVVTSVFYMHKYPVHFSLWDFSLQILSCGILSRTRWGQENGGFPWFSWSIRFWDGLLVLF